MSDLVFRRNLLALSRSDASLGDRLLAAEPDPCLKVQAARSGAPVPLALVEGRERALHSLVDPEREAEKIESAQPAGGFIVALGLGAGYLLKRYLASPATTGLLVIEYSAPLLRALLENIDLSDLFVDERFSLVLDPEPEELRRLIPTLYVPPLAGDIRSLPLHGRVELDRGLFGQAAEALRSVLSRISDDYSVQAFFGKLWFENAVRNVFAAEKLTASLPPIRGAVITAAGPSLEASFPAVREAQEKGDFLIATDTSLPAVLGAGLLPGAVVSIDCQRISYYHFLGGIPKGVPLVLDLASPSRLNRLSDSVRFFSSGHPFCAYVSARWRPFPALDTSGGNVTHAALSLAEALGAKTALLAGADFSYPEGKSYARGTYIYGYYDKSQCRLAPFESLFAGFLFRGAETRREEDEDEAGRAYSRYVTKPMMAYREHLEAFAARSSMAIRPLRGKGVEIRIRSGPAAAGPARPADGSAELRPAALAARRGGGDEGRLFRERRLFAAGKAQCSAAAFLEAYARELRELPAPRDPAVRYLRSLNAKERDLWTTLLPAASAFQRAAGSRRLGAAELLDATRSWALGIAAEALEEARGR